MAKKEAKTNAMRMVENAGIYYIEYTYDVSDGLLDGMTVAGKTHQDPDKVFKTLVTQGDDRNYYVFVIPVVSRLDLKACARAAGVKSVEMIPQKDLLKITGYIHGGCSPVGMKNSFRRITTKPLFCLIQFLFPVAESVYRWKSIRKILWL